MIKRFLTIACVIVICFIIVAPIRVFCITPLETDKNATLTLNYKKDGKAFSDLSVSVYRVAEAKEDGTFELIDTYNSYPIDIHGVTSREKWSEISDTLYSYIAADNIPSDKTAATDAEGVVTFEGLKLGLYLVDEVFGESSEGTYLFNRFMVYLPTPDENGNFDYTVSANPKCTSFVPKTQYSVTKLWQDSGYTEERPGEVTIEIYKDAVLTETQILSSANNWSYTWYVSDDDKGTWTVAERDVADDYKVTVNKNDNKFTVINSIDRDVPPPQTGDIFALPLWLLIMSLSGVLLVLLGLYNRRSKCNSADTV